MKLTKNLFFLHYFSKFMGILFFVLNYMYISLLLKMNYGFSCPSKIMASPFKVYQMGLLNTYKGEMKCTKVSFIIIRHCCTH